VIAVITTQLPGLIGTLFNLIIVLVWIVFWLAIVIAWVMCLIKAYQSQYFKLPVIGNLAEKFSAK
jgi:uncharacterized membrane protein